MDILLLTIHEFFCKLGVDEIRRRGSLDDKPLRMVKTILHELCKLEVPLFPFPCSLECGYDFAGQLHHEAPDKPFILRGLCILALAYRF